MFRLIAVPALIALSAAALLTPTKALADDRYYGDRDRGYYSSGERHAEHEYRERRRQRDHEVREHERREHEWRERERHEARRYRDRARNGYYDQFGYWRPFR